MKIEIKESINYKEIKKYIPKVYSDLLPANICNKAESINVVIFPVDRKGGVITSRYVQKALQKIKCTSLLTVFFAYSFSAEAKALIKDNNGLILDLNNVEWTDETWFGYKNGCF